MANINKIKAQGSVYDIEDTVARTSAVLVTSKDDGSIELITSNSTVTLPSLTNFGDPSELENDVVTEISDLKSQVNNINVETDTTLEVSGKPADAKAVGDALESIDVDAQIAQYIDEHNIEGVTDAEVQAMVDTYLDNTAEDSVNAWLEEHPEATTTVQDGAITEAKLHADLLETIEKSGTKMAVASYIGKIFDTGYVYNSWVHNNVKYDAVNDVVCVMVNCADSHATATYRCVVLYKINPRSLKVEDVITVNDSRVSGEQFECYGFSILSDGTYMFLPCYDTAVASEASDKLIVWKSSDYGTTWTNAEATVTGLASATSYEWFGLTQLSSGMLLCTEHTKKAILHSSDNGETWTAQTMSGSTHEPTFIDCGNNQIICYCRKTMYGTTNNTYNGTKQIEPAVYHISTDGGVTWTWKGNSHSVTEMTASNCAVAIVDGNADLYVCSRMPHGDASGVVYHYFASLDDAFNDNWGTPKVLFYPSAPTAQDFSYIGATVDGENIQHIFYYDTDVTNEAEIRYLMASSTGIPVPVNSDKSLTPSIPYSRESVDSLLSKTKAQILSVLYDYIISEGGEIPDSGMDGSYYVTDNLYEYFKFMNESKYDETTYSQTGELGVFSMKRSTANYGNVAPDDKTFGAWNGIYWRTNGYSFADIMTVTNGYSVEILFHNDSATLAKGSGDGLVLLDSNNQYGKNWEFRGTGSYVTFHYSSAETADVTVNLASSITSGAKPFIIAGREYDHVVITHNSTGIYIYYNGVLSMKKEFADLADYDHARYGTLQGICFLNKNNHWHALKMRYYKKTLTAEEVKNNYTYEMNVAE